MSKRKSTKFSSSFDISNHSTADILASPSERYSCKICKETDVSEDLVELCKCKNLFHLNCMANIIDEWMQTVSNEQEESSKTGEKPYICRQCHAEVFYKSTNQLICKSCPEICKSVSKSPIKSFMQILLFIGGIFGLVFGIVIKMGKYYIQTSINRMTVSVLVIALMIVGSLMAIISFYYIFVDILTDKRRKVEKVYQRNKKNRKKTMDSLTVINIV